MEALITYLQTHPLKQFRIFMYLFNLILTVLSTNKCLHRLGFKFVPSKDYNYSHVIDFILSTQFLIASVFFALFYFIFFFMIRVIWKEIFVFIAQRHALFDYQKANLFFVKYATINDNFEVKYIFSFSKKQVQNYVNNSGKLYKIINICELILSSITTFLITHYILDEPLFKHFEYFKAFSYGFFLIFLIFSTMVINTSAKAEHLPKFLEILESKRKAQQ